MTSPRNRCSRAYADSTAPCIFTMFFTMTRSDGIRFSLIEPSIPSSHSAKSDFSLHVLFRNTDWPTRSRGPDLWRYDVIVIQVLGKDFWIFENFKGCEIWNEKKENFYMGFCIKWIYGNLRFFGRGRWGKMAAVASDTFLIFCKLKFSCF